MESDKVRLDRSALENFCQQVFESLSVPKEEAEIAADVLVAADARGIPSHGVARLFRYVHAIETGLVELDAEPEIVRETASSLLVDAHGAMGAPVSANTMTTIIAKARATGSAFGTVRESTHFGIAGYYAMMALDEGMLGLAMTNTAALGVPTFGREPMFGTNPIAFAAPAGDEPAFVLDMATTVVTRGKIEVYDRQGRELPEGWAVDEKGRSATDPEQILHNLLHQVGGGILPLGGLGELLGGHKGYGLSVMVDVLCGVLSGSAFGAHIADEPGSHARVSHFFGAIQVEAFRDADEFGRDMDRMLRELRNTPPAEGRERVYYAGLKEYEHELECAERGIPLMQKVYDQLVEIGEERCVAPPPLLVRG